MKRFHTILTLVAITLLGLAAFTLTACSGDEAEAPAQTKADLLRAKAKAFAKKYGVDMSLNEDNIEQIAESLTVEQMEQDFKNFAELKKSLAQQSLTATTPLKAKAKTRGPKIRRTTTLEEDPRNPGGDDTGGLSETDRYKEFEGHYTPTKFIRIEKNPGKYVWIELNFDLYWHYQLGHYNKKSLTVNCANLMVSAFCDVKCYIVTSDGFGIYGSGYVSIESPIYNAKLSCTISWSDKLQNGSIMLF